MRVREARQKLPNFLVIGALKSGTSSLHQYLRAHPQVYVPRTRKELNFFAYDGVDTHLRVWAKTLEKYVEFFEAATSEIAIGEVAPAYLASPVAPDMILRVIPAVKLVIILRQPVDRAYSHYLMSVRQGRRRMEAVQNFPHNATVQLQRSYYCPYVRRYLERFERDQMKVLLFESLREDPANTVRELYEFLDVDPTFAPSLDVWGKSYLPRSEPLEHLFHSAPVRALKPLAPEVLRKFARKLRQANAAPAPPLSPDVRNGLTARYRQDICELQDLLDVDLSRWLAPS